MRDRGNEIRTPRKGARIGDRAIINGKIVLMVKAGKQEDYIAPEQLIEALYGVPVERIVFQQAFSDDGSERWRKDVVGSV